MKYHYRLWFPMVGFHGSSFDKLCEKCQSVIEDALNEGFVIPCKITLDTSMKAISGYILQFSFQRAGIELCKNCTTTLRKFLDIADFVAFGKNQSIKLWRNKTDEE